MKKEIKSKNMWKMLQQHHDKMMLEKKQIVLKGVLEWEKYGYCGYWVLEVRDLYWEFTPNSKLIRTLKPKKLRQKIEIIVRCEKC